MDVLQLPLSVTMWLAAFFGASVFAAISPDRKSWGKTLLSIAVGFSASVWLTPWICEWRSWQTVPQQNAMSFFIGLIGNPLCRAMLSEATAEMAGAVKAAFKRLFGFKDNDDKNGNGSSVVQRRQRPDSDPAK